MKLVPVVAAAALVITAAACTKASGTPAASSSSAPSSAPSSVPSSSAPPTTAAPAANPHQATPEKVQAALAAFEKLINETMAATGLPGLAVAVVYRDQVVDLKGYGVREVGQPDLVDADTVFQLASVSK